MQNNSTTLPENVFKDYAEERLRIMPQFMYSISYLKGKPKKVHHFFTNATRALEFYDSCVEASKPIVDILQSITVYLDRGPVKLDQLTKQAITIPGRPNLQLNNNQHINP